MFIGGATNDDVERMRQEAEAEALAKKKRKRKTPCQTVQPPTQAGGDAEHVASLVAAHIKGDLVRVEGKVDALRGSLVQLQDFVKKQICDHSAQLLVFQNSYKTILDSIASLSTQDHPRSGEVNPAVVDPATDCNIQQTTSQCNPMTPADDTAYIDRVVASVLESHGDANAEGPGTENATPAIGGDTDMINEDTNITQKTPAEDNVNVESHDDEQNVDVDESSDGEPSEVGSEDEHMSSEDVETHIDDEAPPPVPEADQTDATEADQTDATIPIRKSTRLKAVTKSLVGVYHCDKLILNRFREAQLGAINKDTTTDLLSKFSKLLDILKTTKSITVDGITVTNKDIQDLVGRGRALPSKMVDVLMHHSQVITSQLPNTCNRCCFLNTKKDEFSITPNAVEFLGDPEAQAFESSRFYLPFNFDRNYWTGLCVDSTTWTLTVLDCNASIRNDSAMTKELTPISQMFPYLLKQAGRNMCPRELRALTIERPRTIPQNLKTTDSGVMTALLMLAHAVAGLEACNYLTPEALDQEAKRLAVMIYEENTGSI
ncbi:Uncharacterized protein Rs2_02823 [Raphanus sativus]|nr:Uncharacterized protein Rs2_02823 [Raphanus sativus]